MKISAVVDDGYRYTVYDDPAGHVRDDVCWVDDVVNQVGVGFASGGLEFIVRVEQRKRVLIITALRWIGLDVPDEEEKVVTKIDERVPELVVVR